jgi:hypothetical protein
MMGMVGCLGRIFSACTLVGADVVDTLGGAILGSAVVSTLLGIASVVMAGGVLIVSLETSWKGVGGWALEIFF